MKLENKRLQVSFAAPEEIQTQRFDNTAIVNQVILDNIYPFCTQEQLLPNRRNTYGMGLCGEFVLETAENAKRDEWFFKPGVGLLKQLEDYQPYDIFKTYETRPFPVTMEKTDHEVISYQNGIPCNGYCLDIKKTFHLEDTSLILDIYVQNTGTKVCNLKEYQHNFVSLQNLPIENGYILEVPCDKNLKEIENKTLRQGDEITLPSAVSVHEDKVYWINNMENRILYHISEKIQEDELYRWSLRHTNTPLSITEQTSFRPSQIVIWAVEHCICAEFYHTVQIVPGETTHWRRTWHFEG